VGRDRLVIWFFGGHRPAGRLIVGEEPGHGAHANPPVRLGARIMADVSIARHYSGLQDTRPRQPGLSGCPNNACSSPIACTCLTREESLYSGHTGGREPAQPVRSQPEYQSDILKRGRIYEVAAWVVYRLA